MRKKKKLSLASSLVLCAIALIFVFSEHLHTPDERKMALPETESVLKVHYIDVGQGDSIFIQLPNGETMLIDAGENDQGETVCDYIASQGESTVDYLVGTHPHSDHIGGVDTVIEQFDVKRLYLPDVSHNTKTFLDVVQAAKEKGVQTAKAESGVTVMNQDGIKVSFLSPVSSGYEEMNDYSAIVSLRYGETSFLFMGDAEYTVENQLKSSISHYDVLKVGHHGSNSSSTANFLEKVCPTYAVISCGEDNSYGHPHEQVLNRLERFGSTVYRTDEQGTVVAESDGRKISFETER